jgi:hypothetical protein
MASAELGSSLEVPIPTKGEQTLESAISRTIDRLTLTQPGLERLKVKEELEQLTLNLNQLRRRQTMGFE